MSDTVWYQLDDEARTKLAARINADRSAYRRQRFRLACALITGALGLAGSVGLFFLAAPALSRGAVDTTVIAALSASLAAFAAGVRLLPVGEELAAASAAHTPRASGLVPRRIDRRAVRSEAARWLDDSDRLPALIVLDPELGPLVMDRWLAAQVGERGATVAVGLAGSFSGSLADLVTATRACAATPPGR